MMRQEGSEVKSEPHHLKWNTRIQTEVHLKDGVHIPAKPCLLCVFLQLIKDIFIFWPTVHNLILFLVNLKNNPQGLCLYMYLKFYFKIPLFDFTI